MITEENIEWCKMGLDNNNIYDEIVIGDKKYYFRTGVNNFKRDMIEYFPNEAEAINKYIKLVQKVSQKDLFFNLKIIQSDWLSKLISLFISSEYFKYVNNSAYNVIRELTDNEELIAVLCGQFGDYGPPPKKASFFVHAIANHYFEGGYFPKGGTGVIAEKIIPTIEKAGGRVLVSKAVKKIIIEDNEAIGVEMENGDRILAKTIVSAVGLRNTFRKLVSQEYPKYNSLLDKIPESTSFMYMFVNLEGEPETGI